MDTILDIERVFSIKQTEDAIEYYDGYIIKTSENIYQLLISNYTHYIEDWGCCTTAPDIKQFINKKISKVIIPDTIISQQSKISIQFIIFEFVKDKNSQIDEKELQIAVYNTHNDYYGHHIIFQKNNEIVINKFI